VHVVDLATKTQTNLITGFITTKKDGSIVSSMSGPDGLIVLPDRKELWAGDGAGMIRVISTTTNTIIANISTGSTARADEFAYDPTNGVVVATNPNETPPYVSVITTADYNVVGKVVFSDATDGLEQPSFNPATGKFYVSVPSTTLLPGGAVGILNIDSLSVESSLRLPDCKPAGIAFGPSNELFVSCSQDQIVDYNLAESYIINATTGAVLANISGVAGVDQVAYSSKTKMYYASAYQMLTGGRKGAAPDPILAVIDATMRTLVQTIPTDNVTAHSVAVDNSTGEMLVPISAKGILIYTLGASNATSTSTSTPSGTASATSTPGTGSASLRLPELFVCGLFTTLAIFAQL
jgi:DNA-binding beta-propeller fold protein YncE